MDPLKQLQAIARSVDSLETEDEINKALDEAEFVFELLEPELQDAADQIIKSDGARALSTDGRNWHIQARVETRVRDWSTFSRQTTTRRYVAYAVWSHREGLSRVPLDPTLPIDEITSAATEMAVRVADSCEDVPFPATDRYEIWMLDRDKQLPMALVACGSNREKPGVPRQLRWMASLEGDHDFLPAGFPVGSGPVPGSETMQYARRVESLVECLAGVRPQAAWFVRDERGAGTVLVSVTELPYRELDAWAFPDLLLPDRWPERADAEAVKEYHAWMAPYLLMLPKISQEIRAWLEEAARKRALLVQRVHGLYPEVINPEGMNAMLVEAELRQSTRPGTN
ncbi:MAG: hypothetical protein U9R74_08805 [Pseudomonadota bacterium]|nr:hypothetical protein [Pseudomonadota bacterium]